MLQNKSRLQSFIWGGGEARQTLGRMPSRRESQGEVGVIGANLVGQGTGRLPPQTRDQNFDNRERNNSTTPIVYFPSRKRSSSSSLAIPTAGSSSSLGYRPVPSRAHRTIQHSNSTGTLTSIESGAHTMTSLEWVRCGSGGKICIFLVLGIILLMLGIFIGAFYLNIQQMTSSSTLTEVLPNYVIALSVSLPLLTFTKTKKKTEIYRRLPNGLR